MKLKSFLLLVIITLLIGIVFSKNNESQYETGFQFDQLNINEWQYWQMTDGTSAHNRYTGSTGGYFPSGNYSGLIYLDGLIYGGVVRRPDQLEYRVFVNGICYDSGLQPGQIYSVGDEVTAPLAVDPDDNRYRIYKATKDPGSIEPRQQLREAADLYNLAPPRCHRN